jgi:hypothetical protein
MAFVKKNGGDRKAEFINNLAGAVDEYQGTKRYEVTVNSAWVNDLKDGRVCASVTLSVADIEAMLDDAKAQAEALGLNFSTIRVSLFERTHRPAAAAVAAEAEHNG